MSRTGSHALTKPSHSPPSPPLSPLSHFEPIVSSEEFEELRLGLEQEAQVQLEAKRQAEGLKMHETEAIEDLQQRAELGEVRVDEEYIIGYADRLLESLDLNRVLRDAVATDGNGDTADLIGTDLFERIEQELEDRTGVTHANQRAMHLLVVDTTREVLAQIVARRRPVEQWQRPARGVSALTPCIWRPSDTELVQESVRVAFARVRERAPVDEFYGISEQEKEDLRQAHAILATERGTIDDEMKHTAEDEENVKIHVADMILSDLLLEIVFEFEPNAPAHFRNTPSLSSTGLDPPGAGSSLSSSRVKLSSLPLPPLGGVPGKKKKKSKKKKGKKSKKKES
jgi:hypothetical protein